MVAMNTRPISAMGSVEGNMAAAENAQPASVTTPTPLKSVF